MQPGAEIVSVQGALNWGPLLARLANKGAIYSTFTEQRWLNFRKTPVVLQGELRYDPALGLSLRYTQPDNRMMILDSQGLVMRDAKGRQRTQSSDAKVPDLTRSLLTIMQFDAESMLKLFVLRGGRDGEDWRIDMEPRSREQSKMLGWITVFGAGDEVRHLVFKRSASQRVEIFIKQTWSVADFPAADRRKFFR
jgi:hypothetical protein